MTIKARRRRGVRDGYGYWQTIMYSSHCVHFGGMLLYSDSAKSTIPRSKPHIFSHLTHHGCQDNIYTMAELDQAVNDVHQILSNCQTSGTASHLHGKQHTECPDQEAALHLQRHRGCR